MKKLINKVKIARAQIEMACELHLKGEYACSLTLAGSAESLTHELACARGAKSVDFWHIKFIRGWRQRFGSSTPSDREILKEKNWARNSIKHHKRGESEEIEINLEFESFVSIKRCIENYQRLGEQKSEAMKNFNEKTRDYG